MIATNKFISNQKRTACSLPANDSQTNKINVLQDDANALLSILIMAVFFG